jgi:hypothetical protein
MKRPDDRVVVCDPAGFVGPVSVPELGTFEPGEHLVSAEIAARLVELAHFRYAPDPVSTQGPPSVKTSKPQASAALSPVPPSPLR